MIHFGTCTTSNFKLLITLSMSQSTSISSYFAESCHVDNPPFRATLCESWEAYEAGECEGNTQLDFGIEDYER